MLFGAAAWRLDLGSKDVSVKARELLLNEIGNMCTRKTCLRNRLTLAKQGPVTYGLLRSVIFFNTACRDRPKQYHKKEREIRVAAGATNGLGEAPSLAFIETDLAALMLSDPARLGVKL